MLVAKPFSIKTRKFRSATTRLGNRCPARSNTWRIKTRRNNRNSITGKKTIKNKIKITKSFGRISMQLKREFSKRRKLRRIMLRQNSEDIRRDPWVPPVSTTRVQNNKTPSQGNLHLSEATSTAQKWVAKEPHSMPANREVLQLKTIWDTSRASSRKVKRKICNIFFRSQLWRAKKVWKFTTSLIYSMRWWKKCPKITISCFWLVKPNEKNRWQSLPKTKTSNSRIRSKGNVSKGTFNLRKWLRFKSIPLMRLKKISRKNKQMLSRTSKIIKTSDS